MEEYLPLIIQLASGAVGGNLAGKLLKNFSLGSLWNTVTGILGGFGGGKILEMLTGTEGAGEAVEAAASSVTDLSSILGSVAGGGVGGGVLMAIIGAVKNVMNK